MLRGRYEAQEDPRRWLSARPPDYQALATRSVVEQVVGQLASLNAKLEEDLSKLDRGDVTRVDYGDFCEDPEALIGLLRPAVLDVETRNPAHGRFKNSRKTPRNDEEEALVQMVLDGSA